ncbi:MAG TPA: MgtC/SapB family protein [Gemmatimonadaceae bacterium]|nr:MgtC/SapB family protein [Gemmatimonadaceae bacterium]
MQSDLLLLLRLAAAALCTGAVGYERERAGKSAGLRTHMLVGIGAALFVALTQTIVSDAMGQPPGVIRPDPLRAIDAVATGIGFLGGGIIFVSSRDERVRGLTTAASVWTASALGVACGLGRWTLAVGATALCLLVLHGLARFERNDAPSR